MAKNKKARPAIQSDKKEISNSKLHKYLITIPALAFLIKIITMVNIPGGGWYGADGENYMAGVEGLLNQGFFSDEPLLSYWPAGYPLLLWPIASLTVAKFFYILNFLQSLFFAFSTYYFTNKLRKSQLKYLAFWASIFISFNPTLSLSSLAVGYETPVASCFMMIAGLILTTFKQPQDKNLWIAVASVGGWFALATFMQPRFLLIAVIVALMWALKIVGARNRVRIAALIVVIMMLAPATMIIRNIVVIDSATISTNLGATMRIGAGPDTSGAYTRSGPEVPCEPKVSGVALTDNEIVGCVVRWYLRNPIETVRLSINKTLFFWSPWSGPEAEGTMARNPWLKISPPEQIEKSSQSGKDFVNGLFGSFVSWIWIVGQILFLFIGYRSLRKIGPDEKFFADIVTMPVVLSWLISIGTIGDHRFRIPTMSMSLFLQVAAFLAIRKKLNDKIG